MLCDGILIYLKNDHEFMKSFQINKQTKKNLRQTFTIKWEKKLTTASFCLGGNGAVSEVEHH